MAVTLHEDVGKAAPSTRVFVVKVALFQDGSEHNCGIAINTRFDVIETERLDAKRALANVGLRSLLGDELTGRCRKNPLVRNATAEGLDILPYQGVAPVIFNFNQAICIGPGGNISRQNGAC